MNREVLRRKVAVESKPDVRVSEPLWGPVFYSQMTTQPLVSVFRFAAILGNV